MQLTLCKQSALTVLRSLRVSSLVPATGASTTTSSRCNLLPPNPFPGKRWTKRLFNNVESNLPFRLTENTIDFAVPNGNSRVRLDNSTWTIYSKGIPNNAFIRTRYSTDDCILAISSPELLFAELAKTMHPVEHLMLGHELCGTFSRDPIDPYNGPITYNVRPATSKVRICNFLAEARNIHGLSMARETAEYLNDNAWSPTESLVAALLRLPINSLGYGFGELTLNPRIPAHVMLPGTASSRAPDIVISGTPVGVNYDGAVHLDLDSIVDAAKEAAISPQVAQTQIALSQAVKKVRSKVVDDIRRNRELAANGLAVFPIVKEDLYTRNGLDQVVAHLITIIEQLTDRNMNEQRRVLDMKRLGDARWHMALSLLPGKHERGIQVAHFVYGHEVQAIPTTQFERMVEL